MTNALAYFWVESFTASTQLFGKIFWNSNVLDEWGCSMSNGRQPKTCLQRYFNSKLTRFVKQHRICVVLMRPLLEFCRFFDLRKPGNAKASTQTIVLLTNCLMFRHLLMFLVFFWCCFMFCWWYFAAFQYGFDVVLVFFLLSCRFCFMFCWWYFAVF